MKPILKTSLISISSAFLGGALVFGALKYSPFQQRSNVEVKATGQFDIYDNILKGQKNIQHDFDRFFEDSFFNQSNPFDSWYFNKFDTEVTNGITQREDESFIYYDIQVDDFNSTSIDTKIENGYLIIAGHSEKKNESDKNDISSQSVFRSTFSHTFPLPEHVDPNKMIMTQEENKIVLKFPKNKA